MNKTLLSGIAIFVLLSFIFGGMLFRLKPSKQALSAASAGFKVQPLSGDIVSSQFFAKLRTRDVNGDLPIKVSTDQLNTDRNPFAAP